MAASTPPPQLKRSRTMGPTRIGTMLGVGTIGGRSLAAKLNSIDEQHLTQESSGLSAATKGSTDTPTGAKNAAPPGGASAAQTSPAPSTAAARLMRQKFCILIQAWSLKAKSMRDAHYHQALRFNRLHWAVGVPAVALSSMLGTSIFAALQNPATAPPLWVQAMIGCLSVVSAIFTACTAFMRFGERAEQHRHAAATFESLAKDIDASLLSSTSDPRDLEAQIRLLQVRFDAPQLGPMLQPDLGQGDDYDDDASAVAPSEVTDLIAEAQPSRAQRSDEEDRIAKFLQYLKYSDAESYRAVLMVAREAAIGVAGSIGAQRILAGTSSVVQVLPAESVSKSSADELIKEFVSKESAPLSPESSA